MMLSASALGFGTSRSPIHDYLRTSLLTKFSAQHDLVDVIGKFSPEIVKMTDVSQAVFSEKRKDKNSMEIIQCLFKH